MTGLVTPKIRAHSHTHHHDSLQTFPQCSRHTVYYAKYQELAKPCVWISWGRVSFVIRPLWGNVRHKAVMGFRGVWDDSSGEVCGWRRMSQELSQIRGDKERRGGKFSFDRLYGERLYIGRDCGKGQLLVYWRPQGESTARAPRDTAPLSLSSSVTRAAAVEGSLALMGLWG